MKTENIVSAWNEFCVSGKPIPTSHECFIAGYTACLRDSEGVGWISVADRLPETSIDLPELKMPGGKSLPPQKHSSTVLVATQGNACPMMISQPSNFGLSTDA